MTRTIIHGHGVHTEPVDLNEVELGDTIVFDTTGERKRDKKVSLRIGWEPLLNLTQEAAEVLLLNKSRTSIFTERGLSPDGQMPSKMDEWQTGYAIVIETPLSMPFEEKTTAVSRDGRSEYNLIRSRETRISERFR